MLTYISITFFHGTKIGLFENQSYSLQITLCSSRHSYLNIFFLSWLELLGFLINSIANSFLTDRLGGKEAWRQTHFS